MKRIVPMMFGLIVLAVVAIGGAASSASQNPGGLPTPTGPPPPSGMAGMISHMSDAEFQAATEGIPADRRVAFVQMRDQVQHDRIRIADAKGFRGYITDDAYDSPNATDKAGFHPVYDANNSVVGYWGNGVGFVEPATYNGAQPLDFAKIKADSGMTVIRSSKPGTP